MDPSELPGNPKEVKVLATGRGVRVVMRKYTFYAVGNVKITGE
jgi:hypothetical protein